MDLKIYITPLLLGWGLSFISIIAGSYIITRAFRDKGKSFINIVLLSMVLRMMITVSMIFVLIYFFRVDKLGLAVIFFFFYILFLVLEINYLSDKTNIK